MPALATLDLSFAIPDDADAIQEVLADRSKVAEIATKGGDDGWAEFTKNVVSLSKAKDKGEMSEQIAAQVELKFHEMVQSNGMEVSGGNIDFSPPNVERILSQARLTGKGNRGKLYNDRAPGAAVDKADLFYDSGDAINSIWAEMLGEKANGVPDVDKMRANVGKLKSIQAAYSSHIGSAGGYLLPESFRAEMLQIAHEAAVVRSSGPTVIPMGTTKVSIPAIHETNRTTTLFGGVSIYWTEEEAESTASEAQFKVVVLEPDTMTGYAEIPNELLMDAPASGAFFSATFPPAMAFEEDAAFLTGSGAGQPLGVLNAAAYQGLASLADGGTGVSYEDVVAIYAQTLPTSMGKATWVINQEVLPELMTMGLVVGAGGGPMFQMNATSGVPMTMFGRPIKITEKVPGLNTQGDISLIDFGFYLIGDLQTMTVSSSEHYKFKARKTAFSLVSRVDGQPWLETAITPRNGSKLLSPFNGIATRT